MLIDSFSYNQSLPVLWPCTSSLMHGCLPVHQLFTQCILLGDAGICWAKVRML
jgi:hypothetical protein